MKTVQGALSPWNPKTEMTEVGVCKFDSAHINVQGLAWSLLLLALLSTPSVWAHRGHGVWTDIVWANDRFEITHRLHAADALTITRSTGSSATIDAPEELARLALYVEERFSIEPHGGPPSSMITIGAETEDDFVFVYQEWLVDVVPEAFPVIRNEILVDVEPGAQRFIRIVTPGGVEERRF